MTQVNVTPVEIEFKDRKGQLLRADVYLPKGAGPFPTLLAASPYQKSLRRLPAVPVFAFVEYGPMQLYLDEGYAYVVLDLPGSGRSEGDWDLVSRTEGEAIYDAIEYVATLKWSTGNIGMIGQSYFCWSQWNAARTRPPHLKTILAYDGAVDMYRDWMYHGGIPIQGFLGTWLIGSVMLQHQAEGHDIRGGRRHEAMPDILSHRFDDEWHRRRSPYWELDQVDIPVFSVGVWGKAGLHLRGNVLGYERVKGPKKLLIAQPDSFAGAQILYGSEAFHKAEALPWYDYHLKGIANGVMDTPNVRFFVNRANRTDSSPTWPPSDVAPHSLFLNAKKSGTITSLNDGSLSHAPQDSGEGATSWTYPDPKWMAGVTTFAQGRPDHLARVNTFTSAPFESASEFAGHGVLELFASSDQTDMDVMVKVSVVAAETGVITRNVTQGWLRASHRAEDAKLTREMVPFHKHDKEEPINPREIYELRVELLPMAFAVHPGDMIRLEISNNESVMIDQPMTHWYGQKVGTDTYHHNSANQSRLILPKRK
jgi:uncharacterized protein